MLLHVQTRINDLRMIFFFKCGQVSRSELPPLASDLFAKYERSAFTLMSLDAEARALQPTVSVILDLLNHGIVQHVDLSKHRPENLQETQREEAEEEDDEEELEEEKGENVDEASFEIGWSPEKSMEAVNYEGSRWPNSYKATFLLNYLHGYIQTNCQQIESRTTMERLIELYFSCLKRYLEILDIWITQGQLRDPYSEFYIYMNENPVVVE